MQTYTIGFTKKPAEKFFGLIREHNVLRVLDVRLNNRSQLAGFAKQQDLRYFLREICATEYVHLPELAPTEDILKAYKSNLLPWDQYESRFLDLMDKRSVDQKLDQLLFDHGCLLCSEDRPHHCHRRLVVEFLNDRWGTNLVVKHLY